MTSDSCASCYASGPDGAVVGRDNMLQQWPVVAFQSQAKLWRRSKKGFHIEFSTSFPSQAWMTQEMCPEVCYTQQSFSMSISVSSLYGARDVSQAVLQLRRLGTVRRQVSSGFLSPCKKTPNDPSSCARIARSKIFCSCIFLDGNARNQRKKIGFFALDFDPKRLRSASQWAGRQIATTGAGPCHSSLAFELLGSFSWSAFRSTPRERLHTISQRCWSTVRNCWCWSDTLKSSVCNYCLHTQMYGVVAGVFVGVARDDRAHISFSTKATLVLKFNIRSWLHFEPQASTHLRKLCYWLRPRSS